MNDFVSTTNLKNTGAFCCLISVVPMTLNNLKGHFSNGKPQQMKTLRWELYSSNVISASLMVLLLLISWTAASEIFKLVDILCRCGQ